MVQLNIDLPEGFLDEEVRCGYTITHEMKKVWAVLLDMLVEFDRVCKKHHITYFASGGTMLGAVRHKGFIPWDDDIDLMMFRDQYEKLCKIAPIEFKHPYFFQTQYTDFGSLRGHAQLRNSETTGILKMELAAHYKFNQGIFIDIFPLDSVIEDPQLFDKQSQDAHKYKNRCYYWAMWTKSRFCTSSNPIKRFIKRSCLLFLPHIFEICINKNYKKFEETCKRYNHLNTPMVSTLSFIFDNRQHFKYREDYTHLIDMPFEFLKIPVGINYDHALTQRYGDYKTYVVGNSNHGGAILDPDKPYTEYLLSQKHNNR